MLTRSRKVGRVSAKRCESGKNDHQVILMAFWIRLGEFLGKLLGGRVLPEAKDVCSWPGSLSFPTW